MLLADVAMDQPRRHPSMKHSHSELDVNRAEEYFQGDVELSEEQATILQGQLTESLLQDDFHRRAKRKIGRVSPKTTPSTTTTNTFLKFIYFWNPSTDGGTKTRESATILPTRFPPVQESGSVRHWTFGKEKPACPSSNMVQILTAWSFSTEAAAQVSLAELEAHKYRHKHLTHYCTNNPLRI